MGFLIYGLVWYGLYIFKIINAQIHVIFIYIHVTIKDSCKIGG